MLKCTAKYHHILGAPRGTHFACNFYNCWYHLFNKFAYGFAFIPIITNRYQLARMVLADGSRLRQAGFLLQWPRRWRAWSDSCWEFPTGISLHTSNMSTLRQQQLSSPTSWFLLGTIGINANHTQNYWKQQYTLPNYNKLVLNDHWVERPANLEFIQNRSSRLKPL